jgi:hypothetical protein
MNTYTKLNNYKTQMAQAAGKLYASWNAEFFKKELLESITKLKIPEGEIDFTELTEQEMRDLGFQNWDEHSLLIPIWLFRLLPDSLELFSPLSYSFKTVGTADDDIRFGCVAFSLQCNPNGRKWE